MKEWQCALCDSTLAGKLVRRSLVDRSICLWCEGELARTGRKRCRKCNVPQPLTAFYQRATSPDGRQARCRTCQSPYDTLRRAEYYTAHKEAIRTTERARYAQNKAAGLFKPRPRVRSEQDRLYDQQPERRARQRQHNAAWKARNADKQRGYEAAARERRKLKAIRAMRGQV